MENKDLIAPAIILIGGIVAFVTVLPIISNMFPISAASGTGYTLYYNFWGATSISGGLTLTDSNSPAGWTLLGLPNFLMFLIFAVLGILGIFVGADGFKEFIPKDKVANIPFMGLVSIILGIIDLIMVLLILNGPIPLNTSLSQGFYLLFISAFLLIIGAIISIVIKKPKST